jgi:hypothetical protein
MQLKRLVFAGTLLAVGLTAVAVRALNNVPLAGSDIMERLMWDVLNSCPGATSHGITIRGGGSTAGANAIIEGRQSVTPMTRELTPQEICSRNGGATAEGLMLGLTTASVVSRAAEAEACGGGLAYSNARSFPVLDGSGQAVIDCIGCEPGTNRYVIGSWRDVLALVYGGAHHGQAPGLADCNSPVRRSLVASWGNLFEQACAGDPCPQGLRRAFRPGDLVGTTETFAGLVGLSTLPLQRTVPGAVARVIPFCNAHGLGPAFGGDADYLDQDPIRIPCGDDDQICGHTVPGRVGTLGLVLPIVVPANLTQAQNYPTRMCDVGVFRFEAPAAFGGPSTCPNGLPKLFNKCLQPVALNPDGTWESNCIARKFPVQGIGGNGMDGRTYNLFPKRSGGFHDYQRDNLNRFITGAFYRLHVTRTRTPAVPCRAAQSSDQIACLTVAHGCSLGLTGFTAAETAAGAIALALNGAPADRPHVEAIVSTPTPNDDYSLAQTMYLNTMVGFEDAVLATGEYELARCMGNNQLMTPILESLGFIPVPGGVRCRDYAADQCAASASDACANNPPDLITP